MIQLRYSICVAALAVAAYGQPGFDAPRPGFVFDRASRSVRPLAGIPGAMHIGAALLGDLDDAWIAPGGRWTLVAADGRAAFVRDFGVEASAAPVIPGVDRVAWSRDGAFAALYSSSAGQLQRARLGEDAALDDPIDLAPYGPPTALAIDPTGRRIALGIAGAGVYLIDGGQSPALLVSMARPAALAFSDAGRLYAVDADTRAVFEFADDGSAAQFAVADTAEGAPFEPAGLAISAGGSYLMLADAAARAVLVYDTAARTLADTIALDLAPAGMERLSASGTFLLNRPRENEWLLVLDASATPRVYFVPAAVEESR